jgi:hypothetical protein
VLVVSPERLELVVPCLAVLALMDSTDPDIGPADFALALLDGCCYGLCVCLSSFLYDAPYTHAPVLCIDYHHE